MNHLFFIYSFSEKIFIIPIDLYFETENEKKMIKEKLLQREILNKSSFDSTKSSISNICDDEKNNLSKKNICFTDLLIDDWENDIKKMQMKNFIYYNNKFILKYFI